MFISRLAEWFERRRSEVAQVATLLFTTVFYVAAFPPFNVNEGAFVFLAPFAIWLRFQPSYKLVFWTSLAIGWISWLVLIFWLRHVTWAGMVLLAGIVGLHFTLWAVGTAWLSRQWRDKGMWSGIPFVFGSAALWVAVEYLRGWIFTGFPWLPLSSSQWNEPIMLQSAVYFGAWSISFVLVSLNLAVAAYFIRLVDYAKTRRKSICPEFYLALIVTVSMTFMLLRLTSNQDRESAFTAGVMQPFVPQDRKWDSAFAGKILKRIERQSLMLQAMNPDAIFWPEAVLPYALNDKGELEAWTEALATRIETPIFAGALGMEGEIEDDRFFNSVFLVRPEFGLYPEYYSKRHLVPFGEYIPLRRFWPWIQKIVPLNGDILSGEDVNLLPLNVGSRRMEIGSLICFEDAFPELARKSVLEGAGALFVATNSAWYGRGGAAQQHMAHSVLRAIETRRVVLRVGNDGLTCWIDEYGHVVEEVEEWEQIVTKWEISRDQRWIGRKTPYVENGDWFVLACLGAFGASGIAGARIIRKSAF